MPPARVAATTSCTVRHAGDGAGDGIGDDAGGGADGGGAAAGAAMVRIRRRALGR